MDNKLFSVPEWFIEFSNSVGLFDLFTIEQSYRIYLADETGDSKKIEMAIRDCYYNEYMRLTGGFN